METVKQRYERLRTDRTSHLDRARDCALLTIPTLLPPDGHSASSKFSTPWQTMGARCVNNLAARLLLSLFPPGSAFFRFSLDDKAKRELGQDKAAQGEFDKAFAALERAIVNELESSLSRPSLFQACRQLIVAGNVMFYMPDNGSPRLFRIDRFVAKRTPMGKLLEAIMWETISPLELSAEVKAACLVQEQPAKDGQVPSEKDTLDLYTRVWFDGTVWNQVQEINGKEVPNSKGTFTEDKFPWLALRLIAVDGEDYGRGMVEEYLGDLQSLEALSRAIVQGTAAAAKVLFLVKPNGTTKMKTLAESESGDVREGNADDVSTLQVEKFADFNVAGATRDKLIEALSYAFLLNSAIQRNGERVTAEEIRYMAQELEKGLGGIYSSLSQELQLPMVKLLQHRLQKRGVLPEIPKAVVPQITTGLDALGRGNDRSRLMTFLSSAAEMGMSGYVNGEEALKRLAAADGVDDNGLIKTTDQVAQETAQQQAQALMEKAAGPAATAMGQSLNAPQ